MASICETFSAALAHHQAGNLPGAEQLYRQILAAEPNHVDSLHFLGLVLSARGQGNTAVELIRRAIALRSGDAIVHNNLGTVLKGQGNLDEAITCFRRAVELQPDLAEAHNNLSDALRAQGRLGEAQEFCLRALQLKPDLAEAHNNLGNILWSKGKLDQAFDAYSRAAKLKPELGQAHSNLANALQFQGKLEEAIASCERAIELNAHDPVAFNNRGNALLALGRFAEAVASYRKALELNPTYVEAQTNLANARQHLGQFEEAMAGYAQVLESAPDDAYAHYGRATLRLLRGDFEKGWPEYQSRLSTSPHVARRFGEPQWNGEALGSRTILLHAEQCLGDTIQFVRFASLIKKQNPAARVIVECQRPLAPMLSRCPGVDQLVARGDTLPTFDVQASLMSCPGIFNTSVDTIPARISYLTADQELVEQWHSRLQSLGGFRIGVNWRGQPMTRHRDISLAYFRSLAEIPGVEVVSLQKGDGREELADAHRDRPAIIDPGDDFDTINGAFMDTAAIMMNLDLVISCDTSVGHLAGALGVPIWLALPLAPDWRWMLERIDSPWYPTMRLFRQKTVGDWGTVFDEMKSELQQRCSSVLPFSKK